MPKRKENRKSKKLNLKQVKLNIDPFDCNFNVHIKELIFQHLKEDFTRLTEVSPLWNQIVCESPRMMGETKVTAHNSCFETMMKSRRKYQKISISPLVGEQQTIALISKFSESIKDLTIANDQFTELKKEESSTKVIHEVFDFSNLSRLKLEYLRNDFTEALLMSCGKNLEDLSLVGINVDSSQLRTCLMESSRLQKLSLVGCPEGMLNRPNEYAFHLKKFKFNRNLNSDIVESLKAFLLSQRQSLNELRLFGRFDEDLESGTATLNIFQFVLRNMSQLETFCFNDSTMTAYNRAVLLYQQMKENEDEINRNIDLQPYCEHEF